MSTVPATANIRQMKLKKRIVCFSGPRMCSLQGLALPSGPGPQVDLEAMLLRFCRQVLPWGYASWSFRKSNVHPRREEGREMLASHPRAAGQAMRPSHGRLPSCLPLLVPLVRMDPRSPRRPPSGGRPLPPAAFMLLLPLVRGYASSTKGVGVTKPPAATSTPGRHRAWVLPCTGVRVVGTAASRPRHLGSEAAAVGMGEEVPPYNVAYTTNSGAATSHAVEQKSGPTNMAWHMSHNRDNVCAPGCHTVNTQKKGHGTKQNTCCNGHQHETLSTDLHWLSDTTWVRISASVLQAELARGTVSRRDRKLATTEKAARGTAVLNWPWSNCMSLF